MSRRGCLIDGCNNTHHSRGWCHSHYRRWKRTGTTDAPPPRGSRLDCTIDGCTSKRFSRDLCTAHYNRQRRYGNPQAGGPLRNPDLSNNRNYLPAQPLLDYIEAVGGTAVVLGRYKARSLERKNDEKLLARITTRGHISVAQADRFACRTLRVHPWMVYGDAWWLPEYFTDTEAAA